MRRPIKIFILDDHDDVRRALLVRLCLAPDLLIVGESSDPEAGLQEIAALRPDVVLTETKRADGRGLEVVDRIAHGPAGARVIVLTSYATDWERWAVHRAGAARYLLKDIGSPELIQEIHSLVAG